MMQRLAFTSRSAVLIAVFCGLLSGSPAEAATIYVDRANCPGPGDGSPGNPFCQIQTAINAAVYGDTILVADGVYTGTGNKNLDFGGRLITLRSASGDASACIIDCEGSGRGLYFHGGETAAAVVEGFTIQNGNVTSSTPGGANGGGAYCSGASPTLTNCRISGNTASSSATPSPCGGGVYCSSASPSLNGCTISENTVSSSATSVGAAGGGVYCTGYSCRATLTNCTISGNTAFSVASSSSGGAMYCASSARPSLVNCTISRNTSLSYSNYAYAGGVYCNSSSPTLTNCTLCGNTVASSSYAYGGGLYCTSSSNLTLTNCILWGDTPLEIFVSSGSPSITYCDVQGGYTGTGNINLDPVFAFPDDFHLMPGSACIDAGTNSPTGGLPAQDADANPRPLDGNGNGQALADMGAYEFNPTVPAIALRPTRMEILVPQGHVGTEPKTLEIRNAGAGTLSWSLSWNGTWLQAEPAQGESTGEVDTVALLADATALSLGTYSTRLTVTGLPAPNSLRTVEVVLYVIRTLPVPGEYPTIQAAIDAAAPRDEVVLADGVYTGAGNKDLDFHGKAVTVRSASGDPAACVLDCQVNGRGFYFHSGESAVARVDGLTIRNGAVTSTSPGGARGGGIYCSGSSPTLTNCAINSSTAAASGSPSYSYGGGVSCDSYSSPTLSNCTINGNKTTGSGPSSFPYGGGFSCTSSSRPTLTDCTISSNTASSADTSSRGGGVYCDSSSGPVFANCTISGNIATFWASVTGSACRGGGLFCASSNATLSNCTINGNAVFSSSTSPNVGWPTGNIQGGGIYCANVSPKLTNCTISGNTAAAGAGVFCDGTTGPKLTNCTITGNRAFIGGGLRGSYSNVALTNCILWGDTPQEIDISGSSHSVTYCNVQGGYAGAGNICADPHFAFDDDVHLMVGSPCIDAGTNSPSGGLPVQDADGNARPQDGNGDGQAVADIGAYECNPVQPTIAVSPSRIVLCSAAGHISVRSKTLSLRNAGGGTLQWSLAWDVPWLLANPVQGELTDEMVSTSALTADATALPIGTYTARLRVTGTATSNSSRVIEIVLHVGSVLQVPGEYPTIQGAINAAQNYDEVLVANGTYTGTGNKNLDLQGKVITVRSAGGDPAACVIDCQNIGRGFYFHTGETADAVVEGLTIRNGRAVDASPGGAGGGGVLCFGASPALSRCTITANTASSAGTIARGGGVLCEYGSPTLRQCIITANTAVFDAAEYSDGGGGVYCNGSSAILIDCTIAGNTASSPSSAISTGGGILAYDYSNPTLIDCAVQGNSAETSGGGLHCYRSYAVLMNCLIRDNAAASYSGGGIFVSDGGTVTLSNCTISGNTTPTSGGGVYSDGAQIRLNGCTISSNWAGVNGGGVCFSYSFATLTNCMITGNTVPAAGHFGGGLSCFQSSPSLTNCTMFGNTAPSGGGVYCSSSSPTLTNSILWNDTPQEIYVSSGTPVVTYCDVQGGYTGPGNINLDPGFVSADDFHLKPDSPCIDAGTNNPTGGLPPLDADGNPRPLDGNGDGQAVADMGAYEFQPPPVCGDLDGDYDVDGGDFAVFLAAYGRCVGEAQYNPAADMNGDECVTLVDYQQWLQCYRDFRGSPFAPPPQPSDLGDVNGDGAVNGADVQPFVEVLLDPGEATMRARFVTDFDGDARSDVADVARFVEKLVGE